MGLQMTPLKMLVLAYLLAAGIIDIKTGEINTALTVLTAGVGVLRLVQEGGAGFLSVLTALIPGACFLLFSYLTRQKIGAGDGITLLVCGLFLDGILIMESLLFGLLFGSAFAMFLLVRKKGKNTDFPFLPFLFLGYAAGLCMPA